MHKINITEEITDLSYEAKEYDYKGSKVAIRPWPFSRTDIILKPGAMVISGEQRAECFRECLVGWNVVGADDKPLPCTPKVKDAIFNHRLDPELVALVLDKSNFWNVEKADQEKNSTSGSDTTSEA